MSTHILFSYCMLSTSLSSLLESEALDDILIFINAYKTSGGLGLDRTLNQLLFCVIGASFPPKPSVKLVAPSRDHKSHKRIKADQWPFGRKWK